MALFRGSRYGQEKPTRSGSGSSGSTKTGKGKPLGVPKGYVATPSRYDARYAGRNPAFLQYMPTRTGAAREPVEVSPRYMDGDEWKPASRPVDEIVEMQQKLVIAGYLDADEGFALGRWDGPTRKAYQYLLEDANAAGFTADTMLYRAAQSVAIGGKGGRGGGGGGYTIDPETGELIPIPEEQFVAPALQLQTTNPDDLRRVFRSAVIDKLGVGWSQKEIDELVNAYNWKEIAVQADAYEQEVARMEQEFNYEQGRGGPPTIQQIHSVNAPSPEAYIEEETRRRDPAGVQATDLANLQDEFFSALSGFGGGLY